MIRRIINIDKEKCNGCGACANACHEGAIGMVDGKAQLMRENYCDGLGDCLPACPTGAITFVEREAPEYDEKAVLASKKAKAMAAARAAGAENAGSAGAAHEGGCPGSKMQMLNREHECCHGHGDQGEGHECHHGEGHECHHGHGDDECGCKGGHLAQSQLAQWPCQIKLVPVQAPFFDNVSLLIDATCTAYAFASMHETFMKGKTTIIGCPKLDGVDYSEKLTQIFALNDIKDITLVRMVVPCCGGLEMAIKRAILASGKDIPLKVVTISLDGQIL